MGSTSPAPAATSPRRTDIPSSSGGGLFIRSSGSAAPAGSRLPTSRRGDIHSEHLGSAAGRSGRLFVDERGLPVRSENGGSDAVTYSQLDPNTSDAEALGGASSRVIWGTNVSIQDTMSNFKKFLLNYTKKYRMWADGATEDETRAEAEIADQKEYAEMLQNMRAMGVTGLNVDVRNLKAYPATVKLWHQLQSYPQEVIALMDQTLKDVMVEETVKEIGQRQARQQLGGGNVNDIPSSELNLGSSGPRSGHVNGNGITSEEKDMLADVEARLYKIRPFGLNQTINLRDLNPSGEWKNHSSTSVC